jgi:hypothetical protein
MDGQKSRRAPGGGGRDELIGRRAVSSAWEPAIPILVLALCLVFKLCRLQPYSHSQPGCWRIRTRRRTGLYPMEKPSWRRSKAQTKQ